jgi:hypothetical protein
LATQLRIYNFSRTQQPAIRGSRRTYVAGSQNFLFPVSNPQPRVSCRSIIYVMAGFYNLHLLDGNMPRPFAESSHYDECRDRRKRPTANVAHTEAATPASRTVDNGSSAYCQHRMLTCDTSTVTSTRRPIHSHQLYHQTNNMLHAGRFNEDTTYPQECTNCFNNKYAGTSSVCTNSSRIELAYSGETSPCQLGANRLKLHYFCLARI